MFTDHSRTGLKKLRHACAEWQLERFPWHTACVAVQIFFNFFCPINISILWSICVFTHISGCLENVLELLLPTNNTASETLQHKSGAVRNVDWIFITGAPAWPWLGKYVKLDKIFCNPLFQTKYSNRPCCFLVLFLIQLLEEACIRNIRIVLCIFSALGPTQPPVKWVPDLSRE